MGPQPCNAAPAVLSQPSTPAERSLWQALWQHKLLFLLGSLAGPALASLYYFSCTPAYQSSAQVLVVKKRVDPTAGPEQRPGPVEDYVSTQRELMKSHLVVERALRKLDPDILRLPAGEEKDPTETVLKELTVIRARDPLGGPSNVVTITYRGSGAEECNAVLAAIIAGYGEVLDDTSNRVSQESIDLLTRASRTLQEELARKEAAYLAFLKDRPPLSRAKEGNTARQERLNSIESRRTALLVRAAEVDGQLATIQAALKEGRSRQSLLATVDAMAARLEGDGARAGQSQVLREHLLPLLLQEQKLLERYGPEHPEVDGLRKRIETTRAAIARALPGAGLGEGLGQGPPPDPVQGWVDYLKQEQERTRTAERLLADLAEREQKEAARLSALEFEDEVLRNDIARTRQRCESETKRTEDAQLSREFGGYEARIISPPGSGGVKKVSPSGLIALAIALLLGSLGGGCLVFLAEVVPRRRVPPVESGSAARNGERTAPAGVGTVV